jgi:hypothetical protein
VQLYLGKVQGVGVAVMSMVSTYVYFSNANPIARDINLMSVADVMATVFGIWNLDTLISSGIQAPFAFIQTCQWSK